MQLLWYQVLQLSQATEACLQVQGLWQIPHGKRMFLGPGFDSMLPERKSRKFIKFAVSWFFGGNFLPNMVFLDFGERPLEERRLNLDNFWFKRVGVSLSSVTVAVMVLTKRWPEKIMRMKFWRILALGFFLRVIFSQVVMSSWIKKTDSDSKKWWQWVMTIFTTSRWWWDELSLKISRSRVYLPPRGYPPVSPLSLLGDLVRKKSNGPWPLKNYHLRFQLRTCLRFATVVNFLLSNRFEVSR